MRGLYTELSAFIVIVWNVYHLNRGLKFSALVRTIITEATVYFLAMIALQIYNIAGVRLSIRFLYHFVWLNVITAGHWWRATIFVSVSTQSSWR